MANADVSVSLELHSIEGKLNSLQGEVAAVAAGVTAVSAVAESTQKELEELRADFEKMINEQRRTAALQQASTELVTVRQEMEKKFGNYRRVRNSMIGILQATDAALVKKTTISNVSEELMISTHDYWLAPVLVAVAAWIDNNHDLADRAIKEAMKRDTEHTSLVMALICRRNNRTQTCYEWLSRYFQTQNAADMDEDSMVYIDAYINGVFGPDEKHMCDDYIASWIDEVRGNNSNFEEEQAETWQQYFLRFNANEETRYPELHKCVREFGYIDDYLSRVDAVDPIVNNFKKINDAYVDQNELKKQVDQNLVKLVNSDDKAERSLRRQENYLLDVKACDGDITAARQMVNNQDEARKKKRMDIISQLTHVISDDNKERKILPSEKKTAVSFLRGYINRGFNKYITEKKDAFPTSITMNINGWTGQTSDGSNSEFLKQDYTNYLSQQSMMEKEQIDKNSNPKPLQIAGIILAILGAICLAVMIPLAVILFIAAIVCFASAAKKQKSSQEAIAQWQQKYQALDANGKTEIDECIAQWNQARAEAMRYENAAPAEVA